MKCSFKTFGAGGPQGPAHGGPCHLHLAKKKYTGSELEPSVRGGSSSGNMQLELDRRGAGSVRNHGTGGMVQSSSTSHGFDSNRQFEPNRGWVYYLPMLISILGFYA